MDSLNLNDNEQSTSRASVGQVQPGPSSSQGSLSSQLSFQPIQQPKIVPASSQQPQIVPSFSQQVQQPQIVPAVGQQEMTTSPEGSILSLVPSLDSPKRGEPQKKKSRSFFSMFKRK
ncbi:MAG: hypothetical protein WAX04_07360 [Oscillospiraceae bacterium]